MTKDLIIGFICGIVVGFPVGILLLRETLKFFATTYSGALIEKAVAPALSEIKRLGQQINADAAKHFRFLADYANAQSLKGGGFAYIDPASEDFEPSDASEASGLGDLRFEGQIFAASNLGMTLEHFTDVEKVAYWIAAEETFKIARAYLVNVDDAATQVPRRFPPVPFDFCRGFIAIEQSTNEVAFLYVPSGRLQPEAQILKQIGASLHIETNYQGKIYLGVPSAEDQPFDAGAGAGFEVVSAEDFPSMKLSQFGNLSRVASYEGEKRLIVASATFDNTVADGFRFGDDFARFLVVFVAYEEFSGQMAFAFVPHETEDNRAELLRKIGAFLSNEYKETAVWTLENREGETFPFDFWENLRGATLDDFLLTEDKLVCAVEYRDERFFVRRGYVETGEYASLLREGQLHFLVFDEKLQLRFILTDFDQGEIPPTEIRLFLNKQKGLGGVLVTEDNILRDFYDQLYKPQGVKLDELAGKYFASIHSFDATDFPPLEDFSDLSKQATLSFEDGAFKIFRGTYVGQTLDERGEVALVFNDKDVLINVFKPAGLFLFSAVADYLNLMKGKRGKLTTEAAAFPSDGAK